MNVKKPEINKKRLKDLLCDLIDIYSPSGKENEILEYVEQYLKRSDMHFKRQAVDDKRYNIVISPPNQRPGLLFLGHLDTVPAFDIEKIESRLHNGLISGLGSSDMKSGCAAMLEAFTVFCEHKGALPPASLALVVGEEEDGDGTKAFLEEYHFSWAVVGEPTNMAACLNHYGYIELQLKTYGKRRHASYADHEHNAIFNMLHVLLHLTDYLTQTYPNCIYNIRDVHSADSGFAVPDRCTAQIDIHLPPESSIRGAVADIESFINLQNKDTGGYKNTISFPTINNGYSIPEQGKTIDNIKNAYKKHNIPWRVDSFRSHSDASLLQESDIKPIILGPGELAKAHSSNESVDFAQVCLGAEIYMDILLGI
jgi:acetylornithine deacetylase